MISNPILISLFALILLSGSANQSLGIRTKTPKAAMENKHKSYRGSIQNKVIRNVNTIPFSYTVLAGAHKNPLFYIEQDGIIVISITGLKLVDGKWIDEGIAKGFFTTFEIKRYGDNATSLNVTLKVYLTEEFIYSTTNLIINFNSKLDLTLPLPLDQLSLTDSSYDYEIFKGTEFTHINITGITQNL